MTKLFDDFMEAVTESGDRPIEVICPACGCPVVEHRWFADGAQVGERIECACGHKRQWGKEG